MRSDRIRKSRWRVSALTLLTFLALGCGSTSNDADAGLDASADAASADASSGPEICDDIDNDGDGTTDVEVSFEMHADEPNDSCSAPTLLSDLQPPAIGVVVPRSPTLYPGLDADYYTFHANEPTDPLVDCLPLFCEEHFQITITIVRPPDATSAELCASSSNCAAQDCGTTSTRVLNWTGECGSDDGRAIHFRVESPDANTFDCHPYELEISYEVSLQTAPGSMIPCPGA